MGSGHDGWGPRAHRTIEGELNNMAIALGVFVLVIGGFVGLAFVADWIIRAIF